MNEIITKYLGTKYKFNGNSLEEGLDCINLCTLIGKDLGINIPNINHLSFSEQTYSGLFNMRNNKTLWEKVEPCENTLAVFTINGVIKHVGYMLNKYEFVHIMENSMVTIDRLNSVQWQRRFVGCYKYIGN